MTVELFERKTVMLTATHNFIDDADYARLGEVVHRHCGINLAGGKKEMVTSRILKRVSQGGYETITHYLDAVLPNPSGVEFGAMIDALSTNLTHFFRENAHFEYLTRTHIPAILARKTAQGVPRIRAWSAGCSTGEEPYTLGIVVKEALSHMRVHDAKILATDISNRVLNVAVTGRYKPEVVDAVNPALRAKYFKLVQMNDGPRHQVNGDLTAMVSFRKLNLMDTWPFTGTFDFIFCRNVMIYFDKATQARLVERFWQQMEPGGVLFTGHSESLLGFAHKFKYVEPTIYMKMPDPAPATNVMSG